jgi:hypothetical protein
VVKTELSGVSLTETYQRSRVRGKTKQPPQLIPAQDVMSVLQTDATTTAANSFAEAERRTADQRKRKEREERKMQMRVRTHIDTAIAARARKKREDERKKAEEDRAARVRALAQQRENERARRDQENRTRIREEHRRMVRDAMVLDRDDEPWDGMPGWRMRRAR